MDTFKKHSTKIMGIIKSVILGLSYFTYQRYPFLKRTSFDLPNGLMRRERPAGKEREENTTKGPRPREKSLRPQEQPTFSAESPSFLPEIQ